MFQWLGEPLLLLLMLLYLCSNGNPLMILDLDIRTR